MRSDFNLIHIKDDGIDMNDLRNLCFYTKEQEKLDLTKTRDFKQNYKKWWKRYVKIQKKIAILNNKIRKLEGKI